MSRAYAIAAVLAAGSCAPPVRAPDNAIDLRYRLAAMGIRGGHAPASTTVQLYRWAAVRALASDCKLSPSDSRAFAVRASRCGAIAALYGGFARLLLEEARGPRFLAPLRIDGELRWMDLPGAGCGAP